MFEQIIIHYFSFSYNSRYKLQEPVSHHEENIRSGWEGEGRRGRGALPGYLAGSQGRYHNQGWHITISELYIYQYIMYISAEE